MAIIPVWRGEGQIGGVISSFDGPYVDEVYLAVDEPSDELMDEIDGASQEANVEVTVKTNPRRMGIGNSIRRGLNYALDENYEVAVVMAGNGKDDPKEIPKLLGAIDVGFDYVQGSRFLEGGYFESMPPVRRIYVKLWPLLWSILTFQKCTDVANGFRAYRTELVRDPRIDLDQEWLDGYGLEYYMHYKALTLDYKFCEVPVSKIYPEDGEDYSVIYPLEDFWDIFLPLIYLRLGSRE